MKSNPTNPTQSNIKSLRVMKMRMIFLSGNRSVPILTYFGDSAFWWTELICSTRTKKDMNVRYYIILADWAELMIDHRQGKAYNGTFNPDP